jgi:putative aldouronate transport system permease protein
MLTGFNIIVLRNFFRQIPESLEEAARIDGAGDFRILFQVFIPLSKPALATIALWTCVLHWNPWFDALIFIADDSKQVLQVFLQRLVVDSSLTRIQYGKEAVDPTIYSAEAVKAATVVVVTIPIILIYPFLQKYFIRGIVLGGVKE